MQVSVLCRGIETKCPYQQGTQSGGGAADGGIY